jgi:hypothetical protein
MSPLLDGLNKQVSEDNVEGRWTRSNDAFPSFPFEMTYNKLARAIAGRENTRDILRSSTLLCAESDLSLEDLRAMESRHGPNQLKIPGYAFIFGPAEIASLSYTTYQMHIFSGRKSCRWASTILG